MTVIIRKLTITMITVYGDLAAAERVQRVPRVHQQRHAEVLRPPAPQPACRRRPRSSRCPPLPTTRSSTGTAAAAAGEPDGRSRRGRSQQRAVVRALPRQPVVVGVARGRRGWSRRRRRGHRLGRADSSC
jgi:hypothetical protein